MSSTAAGLTGRDSTMRLKWSIRAKLTRRLRASKERCRSMTDSARRVAVPIKSRCGTIRPIALRADFRKGKVWMTASRAWWG